MNAESSYNIVLHYDLGAGVEAFSTRREGIQQGRIISSIKLL